MASCGGGSKPKPVGLNIGNRTLPSVATTTVAPSTTSTSTSTSDTSATSAGSVPGQSGPTAQFPYGSTNDNGTPIALPPPNASGVDAAAIAAAPTLGPFKIDPNAGPSGWPDACTFTNAAQLQALDPQVTGLSGAPVGTKASVIGGSGGNTPNNSSCKFNLTTKFDSPDSAGQPSWVEVDLQTVSTDAPQSFQQEHQNQAAQAPKYPAQWADYPSLPGGASCFYDGNELQCLSGNVFYYVLGQKVVSSGGGSADQVRWINEIVLPLAEKLGPEFAA